MICDGAGALVLASEEAVGPAALQVIKRVVRLAGGTEGLFDGARLVSYKAMELEVAGYAIPQTVKGEMLRPNVFVYAESGFENPTGWTMRSGLAAFNAALFNGKATAVWING